MEEQIKDIGVGQARSHAEAASKIMGRVAVSDPLDPRRHYMVSEAKGHALTALALTATAEGCAGDINVRVGEH